MKKTGKWLLVGASLCIGLAQAQDSPAEGAPADQPPAASEPAQESSSAETPATDTASDRPESMGEAPSTDIAAPAPADLATIPVQDTAPVAPPANDAVALDEVVVTAQKVKQPLRKVPISVTALGGDFIAQTGSADLADVSLYVPNVRVDADDLGSPQVFIRGFGTNAFNPSFEASVAFVQDDLFFGRPGYFTEAMFDVDRVEVLRGPQGTLFGKNCVAGVFNVVTKEPEDSFEANLSGFGGQQGETRLEAGVGGMLTDWAGVRVSALSRSQDGELYNSFLQRNEEELLQDAGRVKAVFLPMDHLKTQVMLVRSQTDAPFWPQQLMKLDDDTRSFLENYDAGVEDDPKDFRTEMDTRGFIDKGSFTKVLKAEYEAPDLGPLHDLVPVFVVGQSKFHIEQLNELDDSPADIARLDNHEHHKQLSVEARVAGTASSLFGIGTGVQFVAGAFYYKSDYTLLAQVLAGQDLGSYSQTKDFCELATKDNTSGACANNTPLVGLPLPTGGATEGDKYRLDYDQAVQSTALFGQFTWNVTEEFAVTPGVRINKEQKKVNSAGQGDCQGAPVQPCFVPLLLSAEDYSAQGLERSEADVSPKLALQYFSPMGVNYYASYAKGYKSGGFNSISFIGIHTQEEADNDPTGQTKPHKLDYDPERAQTYELGAKARLFDGSLDFSLTGYMTRFENLQTLAFNGVFFDVSNAGRAKSQGLELEFRWLTPWDALKVIGSAGLLDAKYIEYKDAPAPISQGIGAKQNLDGKTIAFAPRETATLTPQLTFMLGDYALNASVDALYQGDQYTDTDLDPNTFQGATTKFAARVSLGPTSRAWSFTLGGTNLTDERTLNQVVDATFFPGTYFAQQSGGRQLYGTLTLKL